MSPSRVPCIALLLFLVFPVGAPAQIGKLKKALGDKAADAGKAAACVPDRPPTYVESISLSAEKIAKVNAGLDAEIARAPAARKEYEQRVKESEREAKAYEKAQADYEKRSQQYTACADKVAEADAKTSDTLRKRTEMAGEGLPSSEADGAQLEALAEKAAAAGQRVSEGTGTAEDRQTLAEFQRTMGGVQARSNKAIAAMQESSNFDRAANARVEQACGKRPEAPAAPASAGTPEGVTQEAGAKTAGMSAQDYALGRELVLGFAMSNTVVKPGKGSTASQADIDGVNAGIREAAKKICEMKKAGVPI